LFISLLSGLKSEPVGRKLPFSVHSRYVDSRERQITVFSVV